MTFTEEVFGEGGMLGFTVKQCLGQLTPERRREAATALKDWLQNAARKSNRADLPVLIEEFGKRIDRMTENMDIQIVDGKPVVKAYGDGEGTLRALERGTNWFDPCADVVSVLISSLWKS